MNSQDRTIAVLLIHLGYKQNRIASLFDVNQGRIAELSTGQTPVQKPRLRAKPIMMVEKF